MNRATAAEMELDEKNKYIMSLYNERENEPSTVRQSAPVPLESTADVPPLGM